MLEVSLSQKRSDGTLIFKDYPDFRPNLTPREMFQKGSFGGNTGVLFIRLL